MSLSGFEAAVVAPQGVAVGGALVVRESTAFNSAFDLRTMLQGGISLQPARRLLRLDHPR